MLFGVVAANAAVITLLALRGGSAPPLRMTGPISHVVNIAVGVTVLNLAHVPALLFYGSAMLLAAARGYAACEMFAVSNWLRRRDDRFGCPLFCPADVIDELTSGRQRHC